MSAQRLAQEDAPQGPGRVRVTAEELSAALSAIEARRYTQLDTEAHTIAIDDAIAQLQLDVTSHDLLAEVEAQRKLAQDARTTRRRLPRIRRLAMGALVSLSLALNLLWAVWLVRSTRQTAYDRVVAAMPDRRPIYASFETIRELAAGHTSGKFTLAGVEQPQFALWTVEKAGGRLYVRGWPAPSSRGEPRVVYSTPPSGKTGPLQRIPIADFAAAADTQWDPGSAGMRQSVVLPK